MPLRFDWKRGVRFERNAIDKRDLWGRGEDIGDEVHAGVLVSQESALRLAVVWRCVRLISETLAGLPVDAVRKRGEIREPVDRPPSWLEQPNPETTWFEFCERIFESLCMDGNAFVIITARNELQFPRELWTLHPRQVEVRNEGRRVVFVWGGSTRLFRFGPSNPSGDVLHIKLATGGGLRGMSPLEYARQSIGLGLVTEKFGARFFGKGQQPSGVLETTSADVDNDTIDIMRETWEKTYGGSERSHRPAIAVGATWKPITIPPEDAQFLQTRSFQVEDIATRFYGIPPHLVGLSEKQTSWGTGVEQQGIGLVRYTLMGYVKRFEQAMSQLLPRGQFLRLDVRGLLRADSKTESEVLAAELTNGVLNPNEWRAILDLAPRAGGDRYMVPLNMQLLGADGKPATPPEPVPTEPSADELEEVVE